MALSDAASVIAPQEEAVNPQTRVMPAAILRIGDNPLWFELGPGGPVLIGSPDYASLNPYTPWALSLFITGIAASEDRLVMAVNRDGFLMFEPWTGGGTENMQDDANGIPNIGLFRIADAGLWDHYTASSLLLIDKTPAVLLYRDDFFNDVTAPPPSPQVWTLAGDRPLGLELGAFTPFAVEEGWEIDTLRLGPDAYWYYRGVRHNASPPELTYRRTLDLSQSGEPVSLEAFRNSAMPEPVFAAPALLRQALEGVFFLSGEQNTDKAVSIVSPEFPGTRQFAPGPAFSGMDMLEMSGYYSGRPEFALVIGKDGRGIYAVAESSGTDAADGIDLGFFVLPALPKGFVYTRIGCLGKAVIAVWEEQETWSVGAAGFMVMELPGEIGNYIQDYGN
ncbi:MAG: hypothetical protein LBQ88_17725 [Treponema sp.]|nr:hypothetical protein [Treponema sp.]